MAVAEIPVVEAMMRTVARVRGSNASRSILSGVSMASTR
jgi:hypothetical protein